MTKNPAEIAGTRYKNEKLMSRVQKTDGTSRCFAQIENIKRQSLGITMIAAPGVPGGAIMAALGLLASMLGIDGNLQGLILALYIAMDSFGTAGNVTGDGAISLIIDKIAKRK